MAEDRYSILTAAMSSVHGDELAPPKGTAGLSFEQQSAPEKFLLGYSKADG